MDDWMFDAVDDFTIVAYWKWIEFQQSINLHNAHGGINIELTAYTFSRIIRPWDKWKNEQDILCWVPLRKFLF